MRRVFTDHEDAYIRANFGVVKRAKMAERLNVSSKQLGNHLVAMGLYSVKQDTHLRVKQVWKPRIIIDGAVTRHVSY
jgi:hypothetical protein